MSDTKVGFRLTGDYTDASRAIEVTRKGLDELGAEVEVANGRVQEHADKLQEAWAVVGKELVQAGSAARRAGKHFKELEVGGSTLSRWSQLGNVMSGVGAALTTAAGTARAVGEFISGSVLEPAMRLERVRVQLAAAAGGGGKGREAAEFTERRMRAFAGRGGLDMGVLLEQVRLATAAGLQYKKAIELVESAWVAAAGREDFATNTVETFVEAMASAGESLAPFVDSLKKSGTDLRPIVAEMMGWDLSRTQEALDRGRVGYEVLLGALRRATEETTPAARAFAEVADTAAAKLQAAKLAFEEALLPIAESLLPLLTKQLGGVAEALRALDMMESAGSDGEDDDLAAAREHLERKHGFGVAHGVGAVWSGIKSFFSGEGFTAGMDAYADAAHKAKVEGWQRYEPLTEELSGGSEPVSVRWEQGAESLQGAARALAEAVQGGVEPFIPESIGVDTTGMEELMEAVNELKPAVGEDVVEGSGEVLRGLAPGDRWEAVHSSLSAVGGGGYSATYRPLKEVTVQEKQLTAQQRIAESVARIERKSAGVAVLG